jgi:hypothetical protein
MLFGVTLGGDAKRPVQRPLLDGLEADERYGETQRGGEENSVKGRCLFCCATLRSPVALSGHRTMSAFGNIADMMDVGFFGRY